MSSQTTADLAISIFEENLTSENSTFYLHEELKFPHWNDILNKITDVWSSKYETHVEICNSPEETNKLLTQFKVDITKIFSKKSDYSSIKKYYSHLIEYQLENIKNEISCLTSESKENIQVKTKKKFSKTISLAKSSSNYQHIETRVNLENLSNVFNCNLVHMLRCHSKQNDPNDNTSAVTYSAFELSSNNSLENLPNHTNLCASCGNNIINLIDVQNGKILKRFNDDVVMNRSKEVYTFLAWTIINGTSVLCGAGKHGQIKLILPKYSACIARIDAHQSQINLLLFHCKYSNVLLSASNDQKIKIWKINLKETNESVECECTTELLGIIEYGKSENTVKENVRSMCFISNDFLLISTELNNYGVNLNEKKLFKQEEMDLDSKENIEDVDIVNFLTTNPKEKNDNFKAKKIKILGQSESQSVTFEDKLLMNKIFFINNLIIAYSIIDNSNWIYTLEMCRDEDSIFLKILSYIQLPGDKNYNLAAPSIFKNNHIQKYCLLQPTSNGMFFYGIFNSSFTKFHTILKYLIPQDYKIKNQKDMTHVSIKDYNLLEKTKVISCVSNGEYIVATTNQNIVTIWHDKNL